MGREIGSTTYTRSERTHYRRELRQNLDEFETFLDTAEFRTEGTIGVELETNLVGEDHQPALTSVEVIDELADESYVHELGRFNLEMNLPVTHPDGDGLATLEQELTDRIARAQDVARHHRSHVVPIGHLPTLSTELLTSGDTWRSPGTRYAALEAAVMEARGEEIHLQIEGEGKGLNQEFDSISPEAACTSMQLHLQVSPERFAPVWNAAQAIAGPQVALAANSPFLLGKRLWHETRIPAFGQALDTRPPEYAAQGVRPRVWFGQRWITSMFDLFEENVRLFPALIPESHEQTSQPLLTEGASPTLPELMLHNGTVWRWNRPIYDPGTRLPHLRIENRLLPSGPTPVDMAANAAFFYGILESLASERRPLWSRMSFEQASEAFRKCAQWGLEARVTWPKLGLVRVADLLVDHLIPLAAQGLRDLGTDDALVERYQEVLLGRARSGRNGARWQIDTVTSLELRGDSRETALARMTELYLENLADGLPVHRWPVPVRQGRG